MKLSLIRTLGLKALESFLAKKLKYDLYSEHFAADLTEILQDNLPEDEASAQTLAHRCAQNEADAVDKVNEVLDGIGLNMDTKFWTMHGTTRRKSWCNSTCSTNRTPWRRSKSFSPTPA